jgi:hypothetical protein
MGQYIQVFISAAEFHIGTFFVEICIPVHHSYCLDIS